MKHIDCLFHSLDICHGYGVSALLLTEIEAARMAGNEIEQSTKDITLIIWAVLIAHEIHGHASLFQYELLTTKSLAQAAQRHHTHQLLCHRWYLAETVEQAQTVAIHFIIALQSVQLTIEQHALAIARQSVTTIL